MAGSMMDGTWTDSSGKMFDPTTGVSWRAQLVRAMGGRNQLTDKIVDVIYHQHNYTVKFTNRSEMQFPRRDWLDDTMLARIALEAP